MTSRAVLMMLTGMLLACTAVPAVEQALAASAPPQSAASPSVAPARPAPRRGPVVIAKVRCKVLLSAAEDDRAAASMFYLGYESARAHIGVIDVSRIEHIERQALRYCLAHPQAYASSAYRLALVAAMGARHTH